MKQEKYIANGDLTFRLSSQGIKYCIETIDDIIEGNTDENYRKFIIEMYYTGDIYDLIPGETFLEYVDNGGIIDYDGSISAIFVDGYKSNLGLSHKGLCQGKFLVDKEIWLDLCKNHNIEVNWANK